MAKRKCVICGEFIETDQETVPYKNRLAHTNCFNNMMKLTTNNKNKEAEKKLAERKKKTSVAKPKVELKDGLTEEEYAEKQELFKTIRGITNNETILAKDYKLVSDYKEKYSFTYNGMNNAIKYFYIVRGNVVKDNGVVGIVPYVYDDAQEFYNIRVKSAELNKDIKNVEELYPVKTVKIRPKQNTVKLIDISKIGAGEDG